MYKKKLFSIWITEKRIEDLRFLSQELDMPMSILIRMGITDICKKYDTILKSKPDKNVKNPQ